MRAKWLVSVALAAAWLRAAQTAGAQVIRPSQRALVSQDIAAARIEITYHRPVARGRTLFGALVPWRKVWTPSADTAALFSVNAPIRIQGQTLPAGTYSVFTIPDSAEWTIIFSKAHPLFHKFYPKDQDALRVKTRPREGEYMETLAFYFPMVDADSGMLVLHWGRTVVPLHIKAPTTR